MKKLLITFSACLLITLAVNAQDYQTGIGFRGGLSNGLTIKHFITSDKALEGLLAARWGGFNVTGLYEIHANAFDATGLYWYYGFGGHIGTWNTKYSSDRGYDNTSIIGIDGILGIEYNIGAIPFNISLDYKPGFNILGDFGFWGDEFAISIRYVFGNR
jgi:hypothetical protein